MSVVYRARDNYLGRLVSIKVLRQQFTADPAFLERFRREARAVAALSHPNVVSLYDVGQQGDCHYLVMEYVEGETLREKIQREGHLPPEEAVRIGVQVLAALGHAHARRVVHRDVKPHNILLTHEGLVKVTDFGIAQAAGWSTLVHTGTVIGSAHYFSPEQARGQPVDARSDLYSFGVVLYEMLAGRVPFDGENPVAVAVKHVQEEPTPLRALNPRVPAELEAAVARALAKDPARRFTSAGQFTQALLRGQPMSGTRWQEDTIVLRERAGVRPSAGPDPANPGAGPAVSAGDGPLGGSAAASASAGDGPPGGAGAASASGGAADPPEKDGEASAGRRWIFVGLTALLLALGAAGWGGYAVWRWFQVPVVKVPDVRRLSLTEASRTLRDRGLTSEVVAERQSNDLPANFVLDQDPPAGEEVKAGRTVSLVVSKGPELVTVPDVRGRHRQEAANLLENAGLGVDVSERYDETVAQGYVIEQQPGRGTRVAGGSRVYLVVSKGPPPPPFPMPDLVGSSVEDARRTLDQARLRVGRVTSTLSGFPAGLVAEQSPAAGLRVREGEAVDLVVSQGCAATATRTITVPADATDAVTMRVRVGDRYGERVVQEGLHPPGEVFQVDVCWDGVLARLVVEANGQVLSEEVLAPER